MKNMTLANIAASCGGIYVGSEADKSKVISDITTDSRQAKEGSLFVAIKGEKVDAHRFIPSVYEQGALCVLCEQAPEAPKGPYILVESSLTAVKGIAEFYRQQLDIKVVGITGSVGKTSTKEIIASVLSEKFRVLKTLGNFNNELGVPLTIFRLREEDEIAVIEMGINHFGEMHRLSKIVRPDICVITNIGQCHLEFLGDRDGILRAKAEIFDFAAEGARVILNGDDDKLSAVQEAAGSKPIFFGNESNREIYAKNIQNKSLKGIACTIVTPQGEFDVLVPIPGYHMVMNALAATAVGLSVSMTLDEIRRGIEKLEPLSGRFHIVEAKGMTVVDDCYNANPVSMKASLRVINHAEGRKVAILGDMGELGENEAALHREVGSFAADLDLQLCICIGSLCEHLADAITAGGSKAEVKKVRTLEEALTLIPGWVQEGDNILIKASHFMHFEQIVELLTK